MREDVAGAVSQCTFDDSSQQRGNSLHVPLSEASTIERKVLCAVQATTSNFTRDCASYSPPLSASKKQSSDSGALVMSGGDQLELVVRRHLTRT